MLAETERIAVLFGGWFRASMDLSGVRDKLLAPLGAGADVHMALTWKHGDPCWTVKRCRLVSRFEPLAPVSLELERQPDTVDLVRLVEASKSWMLAFDTPRTGQERHNQYGRVDPKAVPHQYVWKADQWLALTRAHALEVP